MGSTFRAERLKLLAIAGLVAPGLMAVIGLGLMWLAHRGLAPLVHWPSWQSLALGGGVSAASMGLLYVLYKSSPTFERALRESGVRIGEDAVRSAGYAVMLVVVSASGVGEEILFRGGLQAWIGVIPAALLFGFSHGGWRREMWAYAVAASVSGGLFGFAYQFTGDLWVPITAHVAHNILATFILGRGDASSETVDLPELPVAAEPVSASPSAPAPVLPVPDPAPLDAWDDPANPEPPGDLLPDEVSLHDDVAEPVPPTPDSPPTGADDGSAPDRDPERPD